MYQTPYELLQRKSRLRKIELCQSIQQKNLKHRSISYNMQISNDLLQNPEAKSKEKQKNDKQTRMNVTNCLKKSYYYRKFLNKTADGQLTQEEFHKFKETFNKIGIHHSQTEKNSALFRQFWENEVQRKYSLKVDEDKQLQLIVIPKRNQKLLNDLPLHLVQIKRTTEETRRRVEDISEIAKRRKLSLDFELEVQGNKKQMRKKKNSIELKSPKKLENLRQAKDASEDTAQNPNNLTQIDHQTADKVQPDCRFFKKNQTIGSQPVQQNKNVSIRIKSIRPDKRKCIQEYKFDTPKLLSLNKYEALRSFGQAVQQRQIRSSWNSSQEPQQQRYYKLETAEKCRISIKRYKKVLQPCNQPNDIQGWNVKPQNQDENTEVFGI